MFRASCGERCLSTYMYTDKFLVTNRSRTKTVHRYFLVSFVNKFLFCSVLPLLPVPLPVVPVRVAPVTAMLTSGTWAAPSDNSKQATLGMTFFKILDDVVVSTSWKKNRLPRWSMAGNILLNRPSSGINWFRDNFDEDRPIAKISPDLMHSSSSCWALILTCSLLCTLKQPPMSCRTTPLPPLSFH